jgi:hypothetical protein
MISRGALPMVVSSTETQVIKMIKSTLLFSALLGAVFVALVAGRIAADGQSTGFRVELSDPVAPEDGIKEYHVVAKQDERGMPAGYSLSFQTHVCIDEQCRMVHVTMHWDALGFYQRLEYPAELPLTRRKHEPFTREDYAKLDKILQDRDSILSSYPLDVLVAPQVAADALEIDGWSGATPQTIKDAVVDDAAYTTWTMWHWANGQIVSQLRALTEQRVTSDYLRHLLHSETRREMDFALRYLSDHGCVEWSLADDVFDLLQRSSEREHVVMALKWLNGAVEDQQQLHDRLIQAFVRMSSNQSPLVLEYFGNVADLPDETLEGLTAVLDQVPYFQVHLTLRMLESKSFFSERVEANIVALLDHENFFIARRASQYLAEQTLSDAGRQRLTAFQKQYRDRL